MARPGNLLNRIPQAVVLRAKLKDAEELVRKYRILLEVAERIEADTPEAHVEKVYIEEVK